ncbi:MAG: transposase [Bacteroidia bacterium]|nr:transposase [Bacteroidia bacterium]
MRDPDDRLFFSTYTNLNWLPVLQSEQYKNIVLNSLEFLVINKRVTLYAFVIMPNHIHLIWRMEEGHELHTVQRDLLKFTAQHIKYGLVAENHPLVEKLKVNAADRKIQIWERNGYSFPLKKQNTILQKLNYIHNNPLKKDWFLAETADQYTYSSAKFYFSGIDDFGILTHVNELFW